MKRAPTHRPRSLAALGASLLAVSAWAARADVFSPGPLSRAHERLEGLASCTRCHVAGQQLSGERCLECHVELRDRVAQGRGLHGRLAAAERACERCHHEHQGRDFPLVDWGKGGKGAFDHVRTGFPLRGKHSRVECGRCHDRRLVDDPLLREVLEKQPRRETFLGAPAACARCHFDEHRGAVGTECQRCHGEDAWKPARRFDHARAAYPLAGRHAKVACAKCHRVEQEPHARVAAPGQTPPVSARSFVRYRPVAFQACTNCHKDPHQGRFGTCASCHSPDDWRKVSGAARERAFHERTRYPLRGAHARARCEACHPSSRPPGARHRGIPFARCTDCHADAHLGQLATRGRAPAATEATCDGCHGLDAWVPARFEAEDHDRLSYRLDGAHRAVACVLCHPRDPALEARVPQRLRADLRLAGRPLRVSLARLAVKGANDCRTCHRDPHGGQFEARLAGGGCGSCHEVASFRKVRFDHAKDSRFALAGKHATAACGACHRPDPRGVVRYRPLDAACAACHADPHAGQLAGPDGATDCGRCHGSASWKEPLRFVHRPPFTGFTLEGKHARVACERCHPSVRVEGLEVQLRRYRPLPTACEDCHADFHRGAFAVLAAGAPQGGAARPTPAASGEGRPDLRTRPLRPDEGARTRCVACHSPDGWDRVAFDHARTGFPLEGRHADAPCKGCHPDGTFAGAVPRACAACHRDVHQGRLGQACDRCHDATAWRATIFTADAHRRTAFPLTGRHAVVPCESCHGDARDRGFTRPVRECLACHEADFARAQASAALPHDPGLTTCRGCHGTFRFQPAAFPAHDACFPIRSGDHAGIRCRDCHTSIPPVVEPLACTSGSYDCRRCHSCAEHDDVPGFDCTTSRACYECHRFGSAEDDEARLGRVR